MTTCPEVLTVTKEGSPLQVPVPCAREAGHPPNHCTAEGVVFETFINCAVCRGTGKGYIEHPDGTLTEIACTYCHGRQDDTWVADHRRRSWNRLTKFKLGIGVYMALLVLTNGIPAWSVNGDGPPAAFVLHCLAWLIGLAGCYWWLINRKVKAPRPSKHAPGFTDDREVLMGGAFLGGALLKTKWDSTHHHGV